MSSTPEYDPLDDYANLLTGAVTTVDKGKREEEKAQKLKAKEMYAKFCEDFKEKHGKVDSLIPLFFFPWEDLKTELPETYNQWMQQAAIQLGHGVDPSEEVEDPDETW